MVNPDNMLPGLDRQNHYYVLAKPKDSGQDYFFVAFEHYGGSLRQYKSGYLDFLKGNPLNFTKEKALEAKEKLEARNYSAIIARANWKGDDVINLDQMVFDDELLPGLVKLKERIK